MIRLFLLSILSVIFPLVGQAQIFSAGVKAGLPITDAYTSSTKQTNERYVIGPTAKIRLGWHFSVEVDALYRSSTWALIGTHISANVHEWQGPVLVKRELFAAKSMRPFIDGGGVYRRVSGIPGNTNFPISYPAHPNSAGIAAGAGVTVRLGVLHVSPEIRYTRWTESVFNDPLGLVTRPSGWSTLNQADFLVGFTF